MAGVEIASDGVVGVCWYVPGAGTLPLTVRLRLVIPPVANVAVCAAWTPFIKNVTEAPWLPETITGPYEPPEIVVVEAPLSTPLTLEVTI
jgi:hypothetical protein